MVKKADTDPNFPAPPGDDPTADELLGALESFAKPQMLDHKEKGAASEGRDAVEYHASPHAPPARVDHNTFPNAPVIVSQTNPGVAPPSNPLNVTPEERKRLEEEIAYRQELAQNKGAKLETGARDVDTGPVRRKDPPAVETDPSRKHGSSTLPKLGVLFAVLCAAGVLLFVATRHGSHEQTDGASTATTTSTPVVTTATATATTTVAPTHSADPSETVVPAPTTSQHSAPVTTATTRPTAPVTTSRPSATATHTSASTSAPPPTATTASTDDPNISNTMRRPQ